MISGEADINDWLQAFGADLEYHEETKRRMVALSKKVSCTECALFSFGGYMVHCVCTAVAFQEQLSLESFLSPSVNESH